MLTSSMLGLLLLLAGCPATTSEGGGGSHVKPPEEQTDTSAALTSEQLEEVQRTVRNGQDAVTACYTEEMERTKDKKLAGKVTVKILIGTAGRADQAVIGDATLKGPLLHACILKTVRSWEFPKINTPSWFTYPFEFTPAY